MDDAALTFVARLDDQASAAAGPLRRTMEQLGGPVDPITAAVLMQADGTERVVTEVDQAGERAANEAADSGEDAGRRFADGMDAQTQALGTMLAATAAAAGAAAATALGLALYGAIDTEAASDKVAAQLGLTVDEAERVGDVAGRVYAGAWGESLDEVTGAVGAVYSSIDELAGGSEAALEAATTKAQAFADVFEVDVQRAAQVAGQAIRTGLADDATEAFDLLVAASQRVPAALREDLLDAADEYGPFFASLGLSGEKAFGALVKGSEQGMYGIDKTGDALKELTIRATDMSTSSVAAYEAAGLSAEDMSARFLAGGDVAGGALTDLANGLLGIEDPVARANAAIGLFGTPLEDLGVDKIPAFLTSLTDAGGGLEDFQGAADRMATTVGDNAASNLESFKRQATQLAVDVIGGKLLPKVNETAKTLATQFGPTVEKVTKWMSDNSEIVGTYATLLGTFVGGILILVGALKVWTAVQTILNVVLTANPIGLIVVAIAALIAAIVYVATQTTWFQDIWATVWGGIKAAVDAVVSWWNDTALPLLKKGFDLVVSWLTAYINFWRAVWDGIVTAVRAAVEFVAAIIRLYVNIWRTIIEAAVNAIRAVIGWFANLPGLVRGWFDGAVAAIAGAVGRMVGAAANIVSGVRDKLEELVDGARRIAGQIIDGLVGGLRGAIGRVRDAATNIGNAILGPVKSVLGIHSPARAMIEVGEDTGAGGVIGLERSLPAIRRAAENMADAMLAPVQQAADWQGNMVAPPVTVSRQASAATVVTIRHEVVSPDGSVREFTAQELARMLASDPAAAGTIESAVRSATATRDARTLVATN